MKRKKIYYNEEKNVDELKKKHQEGPAATPAPPGCIKWRVRLWPKFSFGSYGPMGHKYSILNHLS